MDSQRIFAQDAQGVAFYVRELCNDELYAVMSNSITSTFNLKGSELQCVSVSSEDKLSIAALLRISLILQKSSGPSQPW